MKFRGDVSDRGLTVQAFGFGVVGCASLWILHRCSGLESEACGIFKDAATRLHWAFVGPLAWLFDWGRRMFETRQAIREQVVRKQARKLAVEAMEVLEENTGQRPKFTADEIEKAIEEVVRRAALDKNDA